MSFAGPSLVVHAGGITLLLLLAAMILTLVRLVKGPQAADRIVALDLFSILVVGFLAGYAMVTGESSFLDVAIAYALIAFLGTIAFSRFLERAAKPRRGEAGAVQNRYPDGTLVVCPDACCAPDKSGSQPPPERG